MKRLAMVLATSDAGVIGKSGGLPWRIPEDMKHFRNTTMGHAVIMGRRTFDEMGKPLEGRRNIVVSRAALPIPGCEVTSTLEAALELAWAIDEEPVVIGGAQIYAAAMPYVTKVALTEVHRVVEGDTVFHFDRTGWKEADRRTGTSTPDIEFVTFVRAT